MINYALTKEELPNFCVMPNSCLVRFADEDLKDIFEGREIKKDDGTTVRLIIATDTTPDMDRKSKLFRRTAEVIQVGEGVQDVQVGDIAILDYKVDNDDSCTVAHDGIGKLVVVWATSTYVEEDVITRANRVIKKDQVVARKGELQMVSDIMGVIRNGEIFAKDPYVFLKYDPFALKHNSSGLIYYEQKKDNVDLEVLAISDNSREKFTFIKKGCSVYVKESDTFRIDLTDDRIQDVILCCNDSDVKRISIDTKGKTLNEVIDQIFNQ